MAAGDINRHINIILNTIYKKVGTNQMIAGSNRTRKAIKTMADKSNVAYSRMASALQDLNIGMNSQGRFIDLTTKRFMKNRSVQNKLIKTTGRFHMELLSVMFAGMALNRAMMGLLSPALKVTGIFEFWSMVLTVLFLPIALAILPWILKFGEFLMGLDPEIQKFIGFIVILGAVLGLGLIIFGQVGLAIAGLTMAFGTALGPIGYFIAAILGIGGATVGVKLLKDVVSGLWERFKESTGIAKLFEDLGIDVASVGDIIKGVVGKVINKINEFTGIDLTGWWNKVQGIWNDFTDILDDIDIDFGDLIDKGTEFMDTMIDKLPTMTDLATKLVEILEKLTPIFDTLLGIIDAIGGVMDFIHGLGTYHGTVSRELRKVGINEPLGGIYELGALEGRLRSSSLAGDFIWRPGQGISRISPSDTVVGFNEGGGMSLSPTFNINIVGANTDEILSRLNDEVRDSLNSMIRW